jgi:HlyD family secretion protein
VASPDISPQPAPELPLQIVDRSAAGQSRAPGRFRRVFRVGKFLPLIMALLLTGAFIGLYFQPPGIRLVMWVLGLEPGGGTSTPIAVPANRPSPASALLPQTQAVIGLGKLIPEGDVTTISLPFGATDARIASLEVEEGDSVKAGALLARLDNEDTLKAAVQSARALVGAREAELAQVQASVDASRKEARASLSRAEASAANAKREFERTAVLLERGVASRAALEQKETARDETAREVERARAVLSRFDFANLQDQPDVRVAARNLDTARAERARAEHDLDKAAVRAPAAGTVLTIFARPGERPGAEGILSLGNLEDMLAEVEVYQNQIGRVVEGADVELTADALPQPLSGTVTRIGLEVGRQRLIDADPAANTDARAVTVTVDLDPESTAIARRFTNLQVTARIRAPEPTP